MARLTRIRLAGFRSIRSMDLALTDRTVLIGANGAGKSNLISFLDLLRWIMLGDFALEVARCGGASSLLHYGPSRTPRISARLGFDVGFGFAYDQEFEFGRPDRLVFAREAMEFEMPDGVSATLELGSGGAESRIRDEHALSGDAHHLRAMREVRLLLSSVVTYHFHDTSEYSVLRRNQGLDGAWSLSGRGENIAAFLRMLRDRHGAHYENIVRTIRLVVPFLSEFVLDSHPESPTTVSLRWRDRSGKEVFGPHQLSDGSLRAIALVTALLQPEVLMPSVIVIDEPELGLHPAAVQLVAGLVRSASTKRQVIVSTQSPRFISQFAPEDVVVVEREEDEQGYGQSTFQRLASEDYESWLKEYDLGSLFEQNVTGGRPR